MNEPKDSITKGQCQLRNSVDSLKPRTTKSPNHLVIRNGFMDLGRERVDQQIVTVMRIDESGGSIR